MNSSIAKEVGDLINDAKASLSDLLQSEELISDQGFIRLSAEGHEQRWEPLTNNSQKNDALIREKIAQSARPVTDLVFVFVGMVDWRKTKSLMAQGQYLRTGYGTGLLFGSLANATVQLLAHNPTPYNQAWILPLR
jgi:hypothetical protein